MPVSMDAVSITPVKVDVLVEAPWLTVARVEYHHGTRYDMTWCSSTEAEDFTMFHMEILPPGSLVMGAKETDTLPAANGEMTVSYWTTE